MRTIDVGSSRGGGIVGALVAVGLSGVVGMSAIAYNNSFIHTSRINYVRAAFSSLEANVRFMAMQPYGYSCGREGVVSNQLADVSNCRLKTDAAGNPVYYASVRHVDVPGARCEPASASCGFDLTNLSLTTEVVNTVTTGVFTAQLSYAGRDVAIAPVTIKAFVPVEVLQSQMFDCAEVDPTRPVFAGFDAQGAPVCRGFADCRTGEFVRGVNFQSMTLDCGSLVPENNKLDCTNRGLDQPMIKSIDWNNGVVSATCASVDTPPPTQTNQAAPPAPPPPPPAPVNCSDVTYVDPQPAKWGPGQNNMQNLTTNFQSAVDQIPTGCKYTTVNIKLRRSGFIGPGCAFEYEYVNLVPGGPSQSMGFTGKKTQYGTAVANGAQAYLTEASGGWGNAAGHSSSACISNVRVIVHSKPK